MLTGYAKITSDIDSLLDFLTKLGIDPQTQSHLEHDYLLANDFINIYRSGESTESMAEARAALGGLHELYRWLWSVKDCAEFNRLLPHMAMLVESATRINSQTPFLSPVTGKQDDKTNKLIETIVGMYAVKVGSNVDLDDPVISSNGANPDVLFTHNGSRVAFACKTPRGRSEMTLLDNLRSAAKQLVRAHCDFGYIAVNAMNIIPHDKVRDGIYSDIREPFELIASDVRGLFEGLRVNNEPGVQEVFTDPKVRPTVLLFIHSTTRLASSIGKLSTMLKGTLAIDMCVRELVTDRDVAILDGVNEFIHNKL